MAEHRAPRQNLQQKPKKPKKNRSTAFKVTMWVLVVVFVIALGVLTSALLGITDINADLNIKDIQLNYTSIVYYVDDETGEEVEYERLIGTENRVWCDITDMPQHLLDAAVSIEDERFYSHAGVDIKSTAFATFNYIFKGSSSRGASTITQQLIKNLTQQTDRTPARKIEEMIRAVNLERKLSKEQILELYLNTIYLSQGCNGVGSASHFYFGKEVSELTLAESAALVGITQYPTMYDPLINPENNKEKQELVLAKMLELGKISQQEYDEAVAQELEFTASPEDMSSSKQSYFVDQVFEDVLNDLIEKKGYARPVAEKMLYSGGFRIISTVDPVVQQALDDVYSDPSSFPKAPITEQPESAMAVLDPVTGAVKGVVGGRGEKTADRILNRATQTLRQPGSTIKPIAVYAPAMENNLITPASIYEDKAITYGDWSPKNYYNGFRGSMTIKYAVEQSTNTVAVQVLGQLGINKSYNFLQNNLGITSLTQTDKNLASLALGGLTDGVTVMEMAAAYAPFANRGIYTKPYTYTKVIDSQGKVILENKKETHVAMSEQTAALMASVLKGVVDNGTGGAAKFSSKYAIGGKTGTTDDDKDRWFIGFTPYYVGVTWVGYDNPRDMSFFGSNPCIPAWKSVMNQIHTKKNLPGKSFTVTSDMVQVQYCANSGMLPTEACESDPAGSRVRTDYFKKGTEPVQKCTYHTLYRVCNSSRQLAGELCPEEEVYSTSVAPEDGGICSVHNGGDVPPVPEDDQHTSPAPDGGSVAPVNPEPNTQPHASPAPSQYLGL